MYDLRGLAEIMMLEPSRLTYPVPVQTKSTLCALEAGRVYCLVRRRLSTAVVKGASRP